MATKIVKIILIYRIRSSMIERVVYIVVKAYWFVYYQLVL